MYALMARTILLYLLIVAGLRIMGKRQIGELEPSELVLTLIILAHRKKQPSYTANPKHSKASHPSFFIIITTSCQKAHGKHGKRLRFSSPARAGACMQEAFQTTKAL